MIIYKATDITNNKIYVGQTKFSLEKRKRQHLTSYSYKNTRHNRFSRAIASHGADSFIWEVVATTNNLEELDQLEKCFIDKYDSTNPQKGYNIKGGGNSVHSHSSRTKELIGAAQRGPKNHAFGKSGELSPTSKKVIDLDTGITYVSATECSNDTGISLSKVCAVCRGDRATAGGHIFRYAESPDVEPKKVSHLRRLQNRDTGEIYYSAVSACEQLTGSRDAYSAFVQIVAYYRKRGKRDFDWRGYKLRSLDIISS